MLDYSDGGSGLDLASLSIALDGVDLLPACTLGPNSATCQTQPLGGGQHTVSASISDLAGNVDAEEFSFSIEIPPLLVSIDSPVDGTVTSQSEVQVTGTVVGTVDSVQVNGIPASLSAGSFSATVPLGQGTPTVAAVAQGPGGSFGTAAVRVIRDTSPPMIVIDSPQDGATLAEPAVTVTGMVNDIVSGTVNAPQATVNVNGIAATVANRAFLAQDVPLSAGPNLITVSAVDQVGNAASETISVIFQASPDEPRIRLVSGDHQTAVIEAPLASPLTVALEDEQGSPVAGAMVVFKVVQNNGSISSGPAGGLRSLAVASDAQGRASVVWTLGTRSGAGSDRLVATATGFAGRASFTATALSGNPSKINVDSGNSQVGVLGNPLPQPLTAVVSDVGHNRLAGVPVTFSVIEGDSSFGGQASVTVPSDSDGRARAMLTLGDAEGIENSLVEADFAGNSGFPATFVASAKSAGDPSATSISGIVLDNTDIPVAGVSVTILETGTSVQTDPQGQFFISPVPVGHLEMLVDGATAQRPGTWPSLHYELFTIAGRDNGTGRPIYLLPLVIPNGILVDENQGGTLTLPQVPGFSFTVAPGSATFPDGSKSGLISVTRVHGDKVPMVPSFGQQPRLLVTVQPHGIIFDPPAAITLPNVDGLAPGEVTELYSFDHDLGEFVSVGTATVSEDGSVVRSDPGVGIIKSGWQCGSPPLDVGSSGGLKVELSAAMDETLVGEMVEVTATGEPAQDGIYVNWEVFDDPGDEDDDPEVVSFVSSPECPNEPSCTTQIMAEKPGLATLRVSFRCTTTGQEVTSKAVKVRVKPEFQIVEATFTGDDFRAVLEDSGTAYAAPHWLDKNEDGDAKDKDDRRIPLTYKRATTVKVQSAKFKLANAVTEESEVKVKGTGAGLIFMGETTFMGDTFQVTDMESMETLPDMIKFFNPLVIQWQVSFDDGQTFKDAGKTDNRFYVTLEKPAASAKLFETVLDIGCRNADGKMSDDEAVTALWADFQGPIPGVKRKAMDGHNQADGTEMNYWAENTPANAGLLDKIGSKCQEMTSMINPKPGDAELNGIGTCRAWANLLVSVLRGQGINDGDIVQVRSTVGDRLGLIVKKWTFASSGTVPASCGGSYTHFLATEVTDNSGVAGQGVMDPTSLFDLHYIVKRAGKFYDPSYGTGPFSSQSEWEDQSLAGFLGDCLLLLPDGTLTTVLVAVENPPGVQTEFR